MKRIILGGKKFRGKTTLVDDDVFEKYHNLKWHGHRGAKNGKIYVTHTGGLRLHRLILGITKSDIHVDHIDGNTLNNLRENLRPATAQQNQCNYRREMVSISGFRGVNLQRNGTFQARISLNGKLKHLGTFKTAEQAARAYDGAARILHGEFATFNFPTP